MDLPTMRARVRKDLRDETVGDQRWTDGELDRHIARAVEEAGLAAPREFTANLTSAGGRTLATTSLTGLIAIEAVEFPVDRDPASYVLFSLWGTTLTVLSEEPPAAGNTVRIYYGARHTLDGTSSTLPVDLEDVVAAGSAGYAALAWAAHAANRIQAGGREVWRNYETLGRERLAQFHHELARRSRRSSLRSRRLYTPAQAEPFGQASLS